MEIKLGAITELASGGKVSLRVPTWHNNRAVPTEIVPDSWIVGLCDDELLGVKGLRVCINDNEPARCYLSRDGWEANKEKIRLVWLASLQRDHRLKWSDFEAIAEKHFKTVNDNTVALRVRLLYATQACDAYLIDHPVTLEQLKAYKP